MKKKKKKMTNYGEESMQRFISRRNRETRKKTLPVLETPSSKPFGAGSHKLKALQDQKGFVKKRTAKKLQRIEHRIKKKKYG